MWYSLNSLTVIVCGSELEALRILRSFELLPPVIVVERCSSYSALVFTTKRPAKFFKSCCEDVKHDVLWSSSLTLRGLKCRFETDWRAVCSSEEPLMTRLPSISWVGLQLSDLRVKSDKRKTGLCITATKTWPLFKQLTGVKAATGACQRASGLQHRSWGRCWSELPRHSFQIASSPPPPCVLGDFRCSCWV